MHHAELPNTLWSFNFCTTTYLINRLTTQSLNIDTPYKLLHHTQHNPNHRHSFGCFCIHWLHPYTSNKLPTRSTPYIFIGYSPSQHAYQFLDPITNRIYTYRHVTFHDNHFPYKHLTKPTPPPINPPSINHTSPS